jgi:hypothetical protein
MAPVFTRRRLHLIIALLLVPLSLRALLPAGYMTVAGADGPRIMLCSDGAAGLFAATDDGQHQAPAAGEDCPFAHALQSAPPPQVVIAAIAAPAESGFPSSDSSQLPPATGPPRQTGARAPPALLL